MSTVSFGFPSLAPRNTEEAWFPRLETDERRLVQEMEDAVRSELVRLRSYPFPKYVGEKTPQDEDEDPVDEDDDQEEKAREPPDAMIAVAAVLAVEEDDGGEEEQHDADEEEDEEEDEDEDVEEISEEEAFTGDEDVDMEGDDGVAHGFDFEIDAGQITDSAEDM